ncbi:hypothetical protein [Micrococcoides hystricis]|uniref:Knr4/Smi1-like domain-containing protein n=1 Tax=Micrococcoides hystricis TaxID=1572761 RepID=A0ABV6P8V8_9MICC
MFLEKFASLINTYYEDSWVPADGYTEAELAREVDKARLDVELPLVLSEFYRALGHCDDFMETTLFFFDPDELEVEDELLLFLEDENERFVWGIAVMDTAVPDPLIYRRTVATGETVPEKSTFSEFVLEHFDWYFEQLDEQVEQLEEHDD